VKILTIVGARPQFVKAAVISRAIKKRNRARRGNPIEELIVHSGQHYDREMSKVFFEELEIPKPRYNLGVGSGTHGLQTGEMLKKIEEVIFCEKPNWVMVYGDTNTTLAGALASAKLHVPVAHVEAGLRSFNRRMPEEVNRVLTDHVSTLLCCPTETAVANLRSEGLPNRNLPQVRVELTGDVMYDAALFFAKRAKSLQTLKQLGIRKKEFFLATVHRAENTDSLEKVAEILKTFEKIGKNFYPVVFPIHPRTQQLISNCRALRKEWLERHNPNLRLIKSLGYMEMAAVEKAARLILTDSGGVQKEAYFHGVPCITLRNETEWPELVDAGWNVLAGLNPRKIFAAIDRMLACRSFSHQNLGLFGNGEAGAKIVKILDNLL